MKLEYKQENKNKNKKVLKRVDFFFKVYYN